MAKIVLINDHPGFRGGGDTVYEQKIKVLKQAGHEVFLFSMSEIKKSELDTDFIYQESSSFKLRKLQKYSFNFKLFFELRKYLKRNKPDLVILNLITKYPTTIYTAIKKYHAIQTLHGPNLFCATGWGCFKNNYISCPCGVGLKCFTNGCVPLRQLPLVTSNYHLTKYLSKRAIDTFITPTQHLYETAQHLGFSKSKHIRLGLTSDYEEIPLKQQWTNKPTIIYAGTLSAKKGVKVLLQSFKLILEQLPDSELILAGRNYEEFKQYSHTLGIADSCKFLGNIRREKMRDIYRQGHVFAMPSLWKEQFGLVGIEALACGLPCVASDTGGIPEWLIDGESGYLVPPGDIQALADRLTQLLKDRELRERFSKNGQKYVAETYSSQQYTNNILHLVASSK